MADRALPFRRYLSANLAALLPSAVALGALYWLGHLAGRPALAAFAGIAVVTAILVQRYLATLARFARFVSELSDVEEPVMPRLSFAPATEELAAAAATLITSQIPVDRWHDIIGEPTIADAILDRIVHNAHRLKLKGDSLRRKIDSQQADA